MKLVVTIAGNPPQTVEVTGQAGRYRLTIDGRVREVDARPTAAGAYSLLLDGEAYVADVAPRDGGAVVDVRGETYVVQIEEETRYSIRTRGGVGAARGAQTMTAPLPGKVIHVAVKPGDRVQAGAALLVIEAMKMENEFKAAAAGTVVEVRVGPGQAVNAGDVLIVIE